MNDQKNSHTSGFFAGLAFGAAAGALGYFFFATKEGKKAKERLQREWDVAKGKFAEEGIILDGQTSLPKMVEQTLQRIIEPPQKRVQQSAKGIHTIQRSEVSKPTKKKSDGKRFKGV